jgi:hypothetical protein
VPQVLQVPSQICAPFDELQGAAHRVFLDRELDLIDQPCRFLGLILADNAELWDFNGD